MMMRPWLLLPLLLAACGEDRSDPCQKISLEVKPFVGEPVKENYASCQHLGYCEPFAAVVESGCGATLSVVLASDLGGGMVLHLDVDASGNVTDAWAVAERFCDDGGCETAYFPSEGGWVMPEETDVAGRVAGRYSFHFAGSSFRSVEGSYDSTDTTVKKTARLGCER